MIIATDIDRTLIPNGNQPYDKTIPLFKKIINDKNLKLIYVTGRNKNLIEKAIEKYNIPYPNYAITKIGSKIFKIKNNEFILDNKWREKLQKTKDWDRNKLKKKFNIKGLEIQEKVHQDEFKISFYMPKDNEKILGKIGEIEKELRNIKIIYSIDPIKQIGLLDIIPKNGGKVNSLNYLTKKINQEVICCGDSGNDLSLLTSNNKAIVVKNASQEVKNKVKKNNKNSYIAKGKYGLNGNYVSGIIEGLVYFKIISKQELKLNIS